MKGQGLEVLLISFRESAGLVKRTVAERGYTATVLLDASGDVTGRQYGVWGPPTAYLVDRFADDLRVFPKVDEPDFETTPSELLVQRADGR